MADIRKADPLNDEEIARQLTEEFKRARRVRLKLTPLEAYLMVSILQLASRIPGFKEEHPGGMKMIREFAEQLKPFGPVTAMTLEWGFNPSFDRKSKPT